MSAASSSSSADWTVYRWSGGDQPSLSDRVILLRVFGEIGARLPAVRAWTFDALHAAGLHDARNRAAVAAAILKHAHRTMVWAREIDEQFYRPDRTIEMGGGDCDDLAMLVYAALRSVGVPPEHLEYRFIRDNGAWTHVWTAVYLVSGLRWAHLEPSVFGYPAGASPLPLVRRLRRIV